MKRNFASFCNEKEFPAGEYILENEECFDADDGLASALGIDEIPEDDFNDPAGFSGIWQAEDGRFLAVMSVEISLSIDHQATRYNAVEVTASEVEAVRSWVTDQEAKAAAAAAKAAARQAALVKAGLDEASIKRARQALFDRLGI